MDNRANEAYLIAIINGYERQINKCTDATIKSATKNETLKEVVATLGDLYEFMSDKKATESKSTLELNADLRNDARAYQEDLAEKECTITTLAMDLNGLGYIEQENKMLEAENLRLKSQLAMSSVNERTIRELKAENESIKSVNNEQRQKIEKLKGPKWFLDC